MLGLNQAYAESGHDHGKEGAESHKSKDKHLETSKNEKPDSHAHEEEEHDHNDKEEHGSDEEHKEKEGHAKHGEGEEHGHEEEEGAGSIGPGKAIEEASPAKGFRLSAKALKTLELKTVTAGNPQRLVVPKSGIVTFGADRGVYRLRDNFFKLVDIKVLEKRPTEWVVQASNLLTSDQIVVQGTGLLRVTDLEASGGGAGGHDH